MALNLSKPEAVVLLHGIWMTGVEMRWLAGVIRRKGYETHGYRYNSLMAAPRVNAEKLNQYLKTIHSDTIHLIAHSLGGIVLCHLFDQFPEQKKGSVIMLGTPLKGSRVAHAYHSRRMTRGMLGQATQSGLLGDRPAWKGPKLTMIAGTRGMGIGMTLFGGLEKPNDGTVSVSETQTSEIDKHITIPNSHFGMLFSRKVATLVVDILKK